MTEQNRRLGRAMWPLTAAGLLAACGILGPDSFVDFSQYEPLPAVGDLDLTADLAFGDVLYWELRLGGHYGTIAVETSGGALRKSDLDPSLLEAFDTTRAEYGFGFLCSPSDCFRYLVTAHEDGTVRLWRFSTEVKELLAPVRSVSEAATIALSEDYYWETSSKEAGAYRREGDEWLLVTLGVVSYCPIRIDKFLLRVSSQGDVTVLKQELYDWSEDVCS